MVSDIYHIVYSRYNISSIFKLFKMSSMSYRWLQNCVQLNQQTCDSLFLSFMHFGFPLWVNFLSSFSLNRLSFKWFLQSFSQKNGGKLELHMQHIQLAFLLIWLYVMCPCPYGHGRHTVVPSSLSAAFQWISHLCSYSYRLNSRWNPTVYIWKMSYFLLK